MNRFSLAVLAVFVASPAVAADIATEPTPSPIVEEATAYDWTGAYIGIHKGGGWLNGDFSIPGASASENFNGFLMGTFGGYNFTFDNFVIGVEGDVSYNWNDNRYHAFGTHGDIGTDWAGSLRGRVGYAFDQTLIYATGGWAATRGVIDTPFGDEDRTFNGWTAGAGIDWAVTQNIFVRGEYRFSDYDNKTVRGVDVELDQHQATIGVAYKF
ncbi:porin family protein [Rhizobium sp. KVB221]|uniref:Porin family protein n=1 Tax=Rhizobium setariae TaxID=2801340 RepID=A0A937CRF7_9HYPH|nr:outer membrane protein [Rhizobium setariae]MBL0375413.1 porin family protein [Rhizobium setariae]